MAINIPNIPNLTDIQFDQLAERTFEVIDSARGDPFAVIPRGPTTIPALVGLTDTYLREQHNSRVRKTNQPVESGSTITDNAVVDPWQVTLTGVASNTEDPERPSRAWAALERMRDELQPVTLVTTLKTYETMLLVNFRGPIRRETGQALRFEATFEYLQFEGTTRAIGSLPIPVPSPTGPVGDRTVNNDAGRQDPNPLQDRTTAAFLAGLDSPTELESYRPSFIKSTTETISGLYEDGRAFTAGILEEFGNIPTTAGNIATQITNLFRFGGDQ